MGLEKLETIRSSVMGNATEKPVARERGQRNKRAFQTGGKSNKSSIESCNGFITWIPPTKCFPQVVIEDFGSDLKQQVSTPPGPSDWQTGTLQSQLNQLDPYHVWTWDASTRMKHPDASSKKLPMWHRYRVELYPQHLDSGIYNLKGKRMNFLEAFQTTRGGRKHRGVLKIKSGGAYDPQ